MSRDPMEDQESEVTDPGSTSAPYNGFDPELWKDVPKVRMNPVLGAPYGGSLYKEAIKAGLFAEPDTLRAVSVPKMGSIIKSSVRIIACGIGMLAFPTNRAAVVAFVALALAEGIGILEEQFENE